MKVYIDVTGSTYTLVGEEREGPFLIGGGIQNKLRVYFSAQPDTFFPSLYLKFANGRKKGPITCDTIDSQGTYTESITNDKLKKPNGDSYGTHTWYFVDFTLSAGNQLICAGTLNISLIINIFNTSGVVVSKAIIELIQSVLKTATFGSEEEDNCIITVYGEDPEETLINFADLAFQIQKNYLVSKLDLTNDVVQTNSDLLSYPTINLKLNYRVLVLTDSAHDDNPSMYQWIGNAWSFMGYFNWTEYLSLKFSNYKTTLDNYINGRIAEQNTTINNRLNSQDQTISGLGQLRPSGVDTSTNILAFTEDKGIYIGSDTGYWYYWDGTQDKYVSGGVYQASEINPNSIDIFKLSKDIADNFYSINLFNKNYVRIGGYYSGSGSVNENEDSQYLLQYIRVEYGVTYQSNIPSGRVLQIVTYDINGDFIERTNVTSDNTYNFNSNVCFIRLSLYESSFPNDFMFCKQFDFPNTYTDYKLEVKKASKDYIINNVGTPNYQNNLSLANLPQYYKIDYDCYVGGEGEKTENDAYNSILIYAYESFDIWYEGTTPTYLSVANFERGLWDTRTFIARYRNNTLPSVSNKLTINKGQLIVITYNKTHDANFIFKVDNLINTFVFDKEFVLNDNQLNQIGSIIKVIKNNDNYNIKMGSYEFPFNKCVDVSTNLDSYDLDTIYKDGSVIEFGNILGVAREVGEADFMGGTNHGDEQIISMNIYCDGKAITSSVEGKRIDIYLISNLQRVSDKTNVIKRIIHVIFENNTMTIESSFKCLVNNFSLDVIYVGMWGQLTSQISAIFNNVDSYDISTWHSEVFNHDELKTTSYIGLTGSVVINLLSGFEYPTSASRYVYYSDGNRLKNYFELANEITLNSGDLLYGKTEYKFN